MGMTNFHETGTVKPSIWHHKPMKTLLIDCDYPIKDAMQIEFDSTVSCFDYDVVMWDVHGTYADYQSRSDNYQGHPSLSDASSVSLMKAMVRRRKEFAELIKMGRAVVIFPAAETTVFVDTGERKTSGTGRNAVVTRIVKDLNLYGALPCTLETTPASGLEIEPFGASFSTLWRKTRGYWVYHSILDKFPGEKIAQIAGTNKVIGSLHRSKSGGILSILPEPYWEEEEEDSETRPSDGLENGGSDEDTSAPELLHAWICEQLNGETERAPDWLASYTFPEEEAISSEKKVLQEQLEEILLKIDNLKAKQADQDRWKRLIFAQGAALEAEVTRALSELGFTVLPTVPGRADVRAEVDGRKIIAEVKGLSKSAAEKNAAQLEKWVSEEKIADESDDSKPVLIVNAWRERDISDRSQPAFPDQMLAYCRSRGHCLLSTSQLLAMARTALTDSTKRQAIREEIFSTVGPITGWGLEDIFAKPVRAESL
jgi:hypothetical protein